MNGGKKTAPYMIETKINISSIVAKLKRQNKQNLNKLIAIHPNH